MTTHRRQRHGIIDRLLSSEPEYPLAHFYKGRLQQKLGLNDAALESYREALAAELRQQPPDGLNLRWYRDSIEEIEALQTAEDSADEGA